ncbi:MAG: hypothetical protein LBE38_06300 [Deltaproteobacteria bacterium]|jgi:hypothetical protein|nr:hypothetical protein [Deltaproteobacteria bacterium]
MLTKIFKGVQKKLIITKIDKSVLTVRFNHDEIKRHREKYYGFFCLLTPNIKDSIESLQINKNRDKVEKCFDDLKNILDGRRLRIHDPNRMEARLFIQFISLIYSSNIRTIIKDSKSPLKYMSLRAIFDDLEILTEIFFHHEGFKVYNETDKQTQKIIDFFFWINWPQR